MVTQQDLCHTVEETVLTPIFCSPPNSSPWAVCLEGSFADTVHPEKPRHSEEMQLPKKISRILELDLQSSLILILNSVL